MAAGQAGAEAPAGVFREVAMVMMARMIKKPEDVFVEITEDFRKLFGPDLLSIILYGSGAGSRYMPGASDLNFLIALTEDGLDDLERSASIVRRWRKRKVKFLFMTSAYIKSSIDSYPVEFLNMKLEHIMVFGADVLGDLTFEPRHIRVQVERELKGKELHLRHGFLDWGGQEKGLRELIGLSLGAFIPLFKALLFLRGYEIPEGSREIVKALSLACPVNPDIFFKCIDIKEGAGKYPAGAIKPLFKSYQ
ncbi:MAG: hypothetical protein Q8O44_01680, partial [Syntrophales bacterium]|nr:hypothetical protein [Syntrophales bacterium]